MNLKKEILKGLLYLSARAVLKKYKPQVINITGSVGKTSTKDFTATVLSSKYNVWKTRYTRNTELSVATEILQIKPCLAIRAYFKNLPQILKLIFSRVEYPEILVLETAVCLPCKKGRVRYLAKMTQPKVGILTKIAPAHLELFKTIDQVAKEKRALVEELPSDGTAILNYDDLYIRAMKSRTKAKTIFYGLDPKADIWAENVRTTENGLQFTFHYKGQSVFIKIPGIINKIHIYPILAAMACGLVFDINLKDIIKKVKNLQPVKGRGELIRTKKGFVIINETYNSNLTSCSAALDNLKTIHTSGRKVAILGDMLELGQFTKEAHKKIGKKAAQVADLLICVGDNSRDMYKEALNNNFPKERLFWYKTSEEAGQSIKGQLQKGDIVLIKGSYGVKMFEIIKRLTT